MIGTGRADTLRIIQHNCARSTNAMHSCLNSATNTADLVLLQEPWVNVANRTTISHPSFQCILAGSSDGKRPRVAAFVSKTNPQLNCTLRSDIVDDPDLLALEVHQPGIPTTLIVCIYNERSQEPDSREYTVDRALVNISLPARAIVCGDFNAHHGWWDSAAAQQVRSDQLVTWLRQYECELINVPDVPTRTSRNGRGTSVLDLAFATPLTYSSICDWAVDDEHPTGSDHDLIRFNIRADHYLQNSVDHPISWPYNYKKADWERFARRLQELAADKRDHVQQFLDTNTEDSLEKAACLLRDLIRAATEESVPFRKPSPRAKSWWNDDITDNRREMAHARRTWKATRSEGDWVIFKARRNHYFRSIRQAKTSSWREFLQGAAGKDVFKAYRYTKPRRVERTPILQEGGRQAVQFDDKCQLLRSVIFPPPPVANPRPYPSGGDTLPWPGVTPLEVKEAIFFSSPDKAPGPDGMTFLNIRQAYDAIPWLFNSVYQSLIAAGYHPRCWREGTGAILKKENRPNYSAPKAYRVIVLLNCLGKIAEKIVARRLSYLSEANQLLHPQQMGGRRQRTALDAAMALTHDIQCANRERDVTSVLFLDVKGAFDHVSKPQLLQVLRRMKLPFSLIEWVRNFLSERRLGLAFDGEREPMQAIDTGIPQGSPTSPILFLLYVRHLFDTIIVRHPRARVPSYIDDVALVVQGNSELDNSRTLERVARTAFRWAEENAVAFDDSKTELTHFHTRRTICSDPGAAVTLPNGTVIEPSTVVR
jgi:Reverse transcriptase (RNA-dependent DNA polymerase)/Endonuclease-reverse transcriptase